MRKRIRILIWVGAPNGNHQKDGQDSLLTHRCSCSTVCAIHCQQTNARDCWWMRWSHATCACGGGCRVFYGALCAQINLCARGRRVVGRVAEQLPSKVERYKGWHERKTAHWEQSLRVWPALAPSGGCVGLSVLLFQAWLLYFIGYCGV